MKKGIVAVVAVVVLGGIGFYAYQKFGFGTGIVDGYLSLQNHIVSGFTAFVQSAGETLFGIAQ